MTDRRGRVPLAQRLDPGGDGSAVRYHHRYMLSPTMTGLVLFGLVGAPVYAAVISTGSSLGHRLVVIGVAVAIGWPIPYLLQLHFSRPMRAVTVDAAGVWVAGHLVAPVASIVAVGPIDKPETNRVHLGELWGWTRLHDVPGVGPVAVPTWFDCSVNHISEVPAVLVVTDERLGPTRLAWVLVSWRRRALVEAVAEVAGPEMIVSNRLDRGPRIDPAVRRRVMTECGVEGQGWRLRIR